MHSEAAQDRFRSRDLEDAAVAIDWLTASLILVFAVFQKDLIGLPSRLLIQIEASRGRRVQASRAQYVLTATTILGMALWLLVLLLIAQLGGYGEADWHPLQFIGPFVLGVILRLVYEKVRLGRKRGKSS